MLMTHVEWASANTLLSQRFVNYFKTQSRHKSRYHAVVNDQQASRLTHNVQILHKKDHHQNPTMPGKIEAHVDCASPYSYFALVHLRRIRPVLETYGVSVDFIPVFLGGINHATGNKPPSTLPARAKYGPFDMKRAINHFGTPALSAPPFFPMVSLLPQRCMCAIKSSQPREVYESIFERLWVWVFNKHVDLAQVSNMKAALLDGRELTESQADDILTQATTKEIKAELNENTRKAIEDYGAFGAPWLWVTKTDNAGKQVLAEPVFGSDRMLYVYRLLGLDFEDVKLLPQQSNSKL